MSGAIKTVGQMKNEVTKMQEQIKKNEAAQKKASQSLENARAKEQEMIKTILESSGAYQEAIKTIKEFKSRNEQITTSITKHEAEMSSLQQVYKDSKTVYDNAKNTLKELHKQYDTNSAEVKEQEAKVEALQNTYNTTLNAYKQTKEAVQNLKAEYKSNAAAIDIQTTAQEELKKQLIDSNSAIRLTREQIKNYERKIEDTKKAVQKARDSIPSLSAELKKNQKAFSEAKKTVKEWGKNLMSSIDGAIKRIGQITVASASLAGGFAIKTGFETAFNLEAYRTQLETAVKDTQKASKLMKMAQDFSNASPFTSQETIQSTATMEAYGVNSEQWLKMVADMAGATNKEMEQATKALIDVLTKQEFQGLEEFGISKEMVMDKANSMYGKNKVFKKSGELRKGKDDEMQKVIETLMSEKFGGGAEKLSKTVKGLWSTITGVTSDSLAKIFGMENGIIKEGSALDILKQKLEIVANTLTQWQQDGTLDEIAEQFTVAMTQAIEAVTKVFNYIKENKDTILFFTKLAVIVYGSAKAIIFLRSTFSALKTIFIFTKGIYTFITSGQLLINVVRTFLIIFYKLRNIFLILKGVVLAFTPAMLPIIAVVVAVAGVAYLLYKNFDTVVETIKKTWNWFKGLTDAMPAWAKVLLLPITPIFAIIDAFKLLSDVVGKAWNWVKGFFNDDEEKNISVNEELKKNINTTENDKKRISGKSQTAIFKEQINKENGIKQNKIAKAAAKNTEKVIVKESKPQINITFNGDFYGYNDFRDKVKGIMDEIVKFHLQNVT